MIDLRLLVKNGVHFGHRRARWNPKMEPYIWGFKNDIHLIDVAKTVILLEQAANFLEKVAKEGKTILWVGTKKAAQEAIERAATETNSPYVKNRWVGGTFTNNRMVRKAITNLANYDDILAKSEQYPYKKKELSTLKKRVARLNSIVGGIKNLSWPIGAVVVVDVKKEDVAIKEARSVGIPVVALVDTNGDPSGVDFVIPGNDDAPRSVSILIDNLVEAVKRGKEVAAATKKEVETAAPEVFEETFIAIEETPEEAEAPKKKAAPAAAKKKPATAKAQEKEAVKPKAKKAEVTEAVEETVTEE